MISRVRLWGEALRTSLWFLPACLVILGGLSAESLVRADRSYGIRIPPMEALQHEGARNVLAATATSMITVAALAFSITLAVLGQTSAQYSSRVIRSFIRDRANQVVLGAFVAIYVYCLVVIGRMNADAPVPHLAIAGAVLGALLGVGVLIYFINHIAQSMQISHIVDSIEKDTLPTIRRWHREPTKDEHHGTRVDDSDIAALRNSQAPRWVVPATRSGYIQGIDISGLLECAATWQATIEVLRPPGAFVMPHEPIATVYGASLEQDEHAGSGVRSTFTLGNQRSIDQDVSFGLRQLVDVAVRALSPGVNDNTTAVMALDRLGALLSAAARRRDPKRHYFEAGRLVLMVPRAKFADLLDLAFDEIRQASSQHVSVLTRMAELLRFLETDTIEPERKLAIERHRRRVARSARRNVEEPEARDQILRVLGEPTSPRKPLRRSPIEEPVDRAVDRHRAARHARHAHPRREYEDAPDHHGHHDQ